MNIPQLEELLKAGVHFGHRSSKRHPQMTPYIFGVRDKNHIIDLEKTQKMLGEAVEAVQKMVSEGKQILFVGTKPQAGDMVREQAIKAGMPYVTSRWLGGLLTNYSVVSQVPRKLTKLQSDREAGKLKKYTKKEQLDFDKEIERLKIIAGGLEDMMKLPDAIFVVDVRHEKTAVREANQKNIPIIALCDTNVNPLDIEYPIPANDDAIKSLTLITSTIADAIASAPKKTA
jgi:small subunit ribosomal protein S2